ncbi:MAG TPA: GNAT family N-acetyltransferase [Thermoleophilaceae bacterium]|nr:GNAT family N-acetyltransferase [Thermoleophilaceae bacterium]
MPPHTASAFEAMRELRPQLGDAESFARQIDELQRPEGYRLVGVSEGERVLAVAGFRVLNTLFAGRMLYIDDLSTHPDARRRGYAGALIEWCEQEARRLECDELHLDSAVIPERQDAHRLYFNRRMRIASYHFVKAVE